MNPGAPSVAHPDGEFGFALVGNRLLCTFELATGEYVRSADLGVETLRALESDPVAPLTISANGRVLALAAAGSVRFFDASGEGILEERATLANALPVTVRMSDDGRTAIVALSGVRDRIVTVDTRSAEALDEYELEPGESPIELRYEPGRRAIAVLTTTGLLFLRHQPNGRLELSGRYLRGGFAGDAFSQFSALGKRGRVVFTVDSGGAALVGLSLKGKQTARAPAPLPDRYSAPVAASPDGSTIAVSRVSASTGRPAAVAFFEGDGRGLAKGNPKLLQLGDGLGDIGSVAFDPTGATVAISFPQSSTILLVEVSTRLELDRTMAVGSADGLAFTSDGRKLIVTGSPTLAPIVPMGPGGITVLPIVRREFEETTAARFARVPGVIVRPGDRAASFANRFFAVAASDSADALFSYNVSSGVEVDRVELGPSMGLLVVAPNGRTMVVSAGGGLGVFDVDDDGRITQRGSSTPGAVPPALAPCIAFHPSRAIAYVTADDSIWRVNLVTGTATRVTVGGAGGRLTNPAVDSTGTRLVALEGTQAIVRCALDEGGGVSLVDRLTVQTTLDPASPRVAYDAGAMKMWYVSGQQVRQLNLLTGDVDDVSSNIATGRGIVRVADRLLAVLPEGGGPIAYVEVADGGLRLDSEVGVGGNPFDGFGGGSAGFDAESGRLFLPVGMRIVSVVADGAAVDIDSGSLAAHVSFVKPLAQLAYPDLARFPGNYVVARGF